MDSPNLSIFPNTAKINNYGHLEVGGCDCTQLAQKFGTPLYVMDEETIHKAVHTYRQGLSNYPDFLILYAGKAFLNQAMCYLLAKLGLGLDVVSQGELLTATSTGFPAQHIYMHGNNKSQSEIEAGLAYGDVKIVVDSISELYMVADSAKKLQKQASILLRLIPGVEPDTHQHIKTGHYDSKFGIPLVGAESAVKAALELTPHINLLGIHAHIGSQAQELEPYLENIEILACVADNLRQRFNLDISQLDIGGGLAIAYTQEDKPVPIYDWSVAVAEKVRSAFSLRNLKLPQLLIEPGRTIVGTAGITLYGAGHLKSLPSGVTYLSVDGGMADNPRPITYQSRYTACLANNMLAACSEKPITIVGKYCESGDIIVKESYLAAKKDDLIAILGTGAYNFSMASNYNRNPRPACVLVSNGVAEVIVERESNQDLLRLDRVPPRLVQ